MFAARFVCSWIGAFGLAAGAFCQTYVPFSVDGGAFPSSINEKGEIAGAYSDFAGNLHGFVRDAAGTITPFEVPNSNRTQANSINAAGVITGSYSTAQPRGFVRHPQGKITTFDPPGSASTYPQRINAGGEITGLYTDSNGLTHEFVREPSGHIISFDPPGSTSTNPQSINAGGEITGLYTDSNGLTHGFVREPSGHIISFDPPGSTSTKPSKHQ